MPVASSFAGARPEAHGVGAAAGLQWKLVWRRRALRWPLGLGLVPVAVAAVAALLKLRGVVPMLGSDALALHLATFYLQFALVVIPLLYGTSLVAHEAEARTLA